jgi:nitrogen regulatory protein P-II 1
MVLIQAIIKPFKLDDVKDALEEIGIGGLTVSEILHTAPPRHKGRSFGALSDKLELVPKIRVDIVAPAHLTERIIEALCIHGSAGKTEDGKITVSPVDATIRIRTGEYGENALT